MRKSKTTQLPNHTNMAIKKLFVKPKPPTTNFVSLVQCKNIVVVVIIIITTTAVGVVVVVVGVAPAVENFIPHWQA